MPKGIKGFQKGNTLWVYNVGRPKKSSRGNQWAKGNPPNKTSFKKGIIPWNKGIKVPSMTGELHPNWRGGLTYSKQYVQVLIRETGKYAYRHRLVMEDILGRKLSYNEDVHHVNRNPKDNRPENLVLMTKRDHTKLHKILRKSVAREVVRTSVLPANGGNRI